jgi:hypothetical protein
MTPKISSAEIEPTPGGYRSAERAIKSQPPEGILPVNISVVSTFTIATIRPYLFVSGAQRGYLLNSERLLCPDIVQLEALA